MKRIRSLAPFALCGLLLVAVPAAGAAIDPFYESLLRRGTDAFNRRDYQESARLLRIACFGLLEEPEELADGLTRLALAQAMSNDADGFRDTFARLGEVEQRFGTWRSAPIPESMREALRRHAARLLPAATLQASPLTAAASEPLDDVLENLPPAERRRELMRRVADRPAESRWRLALARLDLQEGRVSEAVKGAEAVLAAAPGNSAALYLRGLAFAADERWQEAVADLAGSGQASRHVEGAAAMIRGLVATGRLEEAREFAGSLAADVAGDENVKEALALVQEGR